MTILLRTTTYVVYVINLYSVTNGNNPDLASNVRRDLAYPISLAWHILSAAITLTETDTGITEDASTIVAVEVVNSLVLLHHLSNLQPPSSIIIHHT